MDFYHEKQRLALASASLATARDALDVPHMQAAIAAIKEAQLLPDYWQNTDVARRDNQQVALFERKIDTVTTLEQDAQYLNDLMELSEELEDESSATEISDLLSRLEKQVESLFLETLLNGDYDHLNAILTVHAGAGGTEAQDWCEMLYRMYTRYADREGYKVRVLDLQQGDEAGIKSVTFLLEGTNAYGFLKAEKGVHRLVRISPFDSGKRRHTSFASLEVMPEILDANTVVIKPDELRIDTLRSSGAGGQHVNKTESAVRITHLPSGIVVQCQNERSQIQNRETAMRMLTSKLIELKEREREERDSQIKGELKKIEWGSQIRSYVFCPYTLVKDHRTGHENANVQQVMDGDIAPFIYAYLKLL